MTYKHFDRIIKEVVTLPKFSDLLNDDIQKSLISKNSILIPHRSFTAYIDYDSIENDLKIPISVIEKCYALKNETLKKINTTFLKKLM